jgi:hypothetical protein
MKTVIQTQSFLTSVRDAGLSEEFQAFIVQTIADDPMMGVVIAGTGGCRKCRWPGRGKGKSGGYRVITYFGGGDIPVFLLTVFSKGERTNLSRAERNELAKLAKTLRASLTDAVTQLRRRP